MHPIFLDVEATGLKNEPRIVQLAHKDSATGVIFNELFNPPIPIEFGAMAIHHITHEMVADKPAFQGSEQKEQLIALLAENILVAHNAPYDMGVLKTEGVAVPYWIDTCRVAQHILRSDSHSLQYLRYSLNLNTEGTAHDALGDILVLEALFNHLVEIVKRDYELEKNEDVWTKMEELSTIPIVIESFTFGKYNGMTFEQVAQSDRGYLEWLYKSESAKPVGDQNESMIHTLKMHLGI